MGEHMNASKWGDVIGRGAGLAMRAVRYIVIVAACIKYLLA